jgi:hypothetical protein
MRVGYPAPAEREGKSARPSGIPMIVGGSGLSLGLGLGLVLALLCALVVIGLP